MRMDVPAMQGIAGDLTRSAQAVNDAARRVATAAQGFDPTHAGRDYTAQGARVAQALAGVSQRLFAWANCVNDTGGVLGTVVSAHTATDRDSAAELGPSGEVRV
ncbi:hypothetical protein ACWDSJ_05765 [Nocardia sp. NPDC003482]|uniref:hypothetical protein n=1 Tax=Nocardia sp. NPDC004068 TaxID=3364303 RepID=UPI00367AB28D